MRPLPRWSPRATKVLVIAASWTVGSVVAYVNTYLLIQDLIRLGKLDGAYPFLPDLAGNVVLGLGGGLVGGYMLVYRLNSGRRHRSFMSDILRSGLYFVMLYVGAGAAFLFLMAFGYNVLEVDAAAALRAGWANVVVNLTTPSFVSNMLVWALVVSGTQFMLQVIDKFGPGTLWKLITGRYYHPREEQRVFMFLDLQSSTALAEQLGHRRFFELLRELYQDITRPITDCAGEIYQYVGDEVIVSWPPTRAFQDGNCLRCFFRIDEAIGAKRSDYLKRFGVAPVFKAGLHVGAATVGEIGVVKKDIVFSGDVLNTTARIQGECNRHRVNLLASADVLESIRVDDSFHALPIGEIPLRGKTEPLALSVVLPA